MTSGRKQAVTGKRNGFTIGMIAEKPKNSPPAMPGGGMGGGGMGGMDY